MAQFQRHFVQDLTKPLIVRQCGDLGFSGDNLSDVISVDLYTDGEAYSGGGTCAGACICPDGSTVALTGSVSGKTASVTLTEDCFAIPGQIGIAIRVTSGTTKTTVLKATYNVEQFATNNPVDPGSRIALDVGDLINRIDAAVESIPASADQLKAAMAPNFSATTAYPAGAYVWYNGTLYKFTAAHAAGSWTGTDATAVALGNDVADLKSHINKEYYTIEPTIVTGSYTAYAASGGPFYQINNNAGLQYAEFPVHYNEKYKVTGNLTQAGAVRSFFTISDKAYLSVISISGGEVEFIVPYGAKSAIICGYTGTPITVKRMDQNGLAGKNVAVFGDSLMAGLELNYGAVDSSLSVSRGIWGRVADHYGCNIVSNQSLGGATIESIYNGDDSEGRDSTAIARRLFSYDNTNTDLIIFTGGYNDAQKQYAGQTVYNIGELTPVNNLNVSDWGSCISCLESAFTHLRYKNPFCKIIWIRSWYGGGANEAALVKEYYDAIEACCNKWGVAVCDINRNGNINLLNADDAAKFGRKNYTSATSSTTDTMHLSNVGFDFIMPVVYDTIDRVLKY